jgi:uncharacterized protein YbjT (DUF2867 family)
MNYIYNNIPCLNLAAIYVDEDDIAMYTIKTIDDPRTLNKTVYIRPPKNILSQREVVEIWEKLIGHDLHKSSISKEDFLASMEGEIHLLINFIILDISCVAQK